MTFVPRRSLLRLLSSTTAALTSAAAILASPAIAQAAPQPLTDAEIVALPLSQQAALLNPLRATASALDAVGRGRGAGIYSGVSIDAPHRRVDLFLTDTAKARTFLAEAKAGHPSVNLVSVSVARSKFSRAALHAARDQVLRSAATLPIQVDSASAPADGHALVLGVEQRPGQANRSLATSLPKVAGVDVVLTAGQKATPSDRYNDTAPYVAGDYVTNSGWSCTTGIPMADSSGRTYISIASHCGHTGTTWYTGGGHTVGTVSGYSTQWDVAIIPTSSVAEEYDTGGRLFYLDSTAYSYNGDYVCQNGYTSQMVCGIKVNNADIYVTLGAERYSSFTARGVTGYRVGGGTACQGGDSGGLVFSIDGSTTRQIRGQVSGTINGTGGNTMFWTEALDIYSAYGLHKAP
ncbi:MAG: hypothetical protein JWN00_6077 [Actinomycetia bacterium]|nr:hypothetical protein [Actinomycetes bacterium]